MPNLLRNVLAILAGIAIGGGVNMALITLSPSLIPPPTGVDVNNAESLSKAMHLFEPRHFVMPFLTYSESVTTSTSQTSFRNLRPSIAAVNSIRLLVVCGTAPDNSLAWSL